MAKEVSQKIDLTEDRLFSGFGWRFFNEFLMIHHKSDSNIPYWMNNTVGFFSSDGDLYGEQSTFYWKMKEDAEEFNLDGEEASHCVRCGKRLFLRSYDMCEKCSDICEDDDINSFGNLIRRKFEEDNFEL